MGIKIKDFGKILTIVGVLILFTGIIYLFDRKLLLLGNTIFLTGLVLMIGLSDLKSFVFSSGRTKIFLIVMFGIVIMLIGYNVIGIVIELIGLLALLGIYLPVVIRFLHSIPLINNIFNISQLRSFSEWFSPDDRLPL
ncbi:golgi transport protein 1-related [Anaeramoeba flamelloides]|uniref:Golgi transport protein 1-related n=1 Tax=Anaeramoeba flamelloides TaxID=1746091 RepID=A0AAV8A9M1_9EUKA|nr:golgi transport protein 1-related [Anaeramoeba flamelloides]